MKKPKHSKFKNPSIIYELLVSRLTSDVVSGKDSPAIDIIRKYYSKTELSKEHKIYQTLVSAKYLNENKAESLINAALELSTRLNKTTLRREKYNLIKEIKDVYGVEEFFKTKINNYSQHAAIYNLIEMKNSNEFIDPSYIVDNRVTLLEHITKSEVDKDNLEDKIFEEYVALGKGDRLLVYRLMLEKFNNKYSTLSKEQKTILKEYINNISNTVKLREFVNHNYKIIISELNVLVPKIDDQTTKIKLNEIISLMVPIEKTQNVKDENIISLLQYYQLVNELKSIKK